MSYNSTVYDEIYYRSHCGDCYERGHGWEQIFAGQAERIVKELTPKKTLDVGCAVGYLVEGLRDRGVDAWGIDISDYAISKVREDIKPYCNIGSAVDEITEKYDLITCIEVMEHLKPEEYNKAIENMCKATDTILFSSTPFDYNEESHYSINNSGYWSRIFAYNGFFHDVDYDASYVAVQAKVYRRKSISMAELVYSYENRMFELWNENVTLRDNVNIAQARIRDLDKGNIAHAQEVYDLEEKIKKQEMERQTFIDQYNVEKNQVIEDLTKERDKIAAELNKRNENVVEELKKRHVELMKDEYEKRDIIENKLEVLKRHTEFLESELWKYKETQNVTNFGNPTYAEISLKNMENSLSWKITKPLRVIDSLIRRKDV